MGFEDRPSNTHPEVLATKHMNEDEVLNYVYETYIKEPDEEKETNTNNNNDRIHNDNSTISKEQQ